MNCPKCGYGYSKIIDSRPTENGKRRRHECGGCGFRYTGIEISAEKYRKMNKLYRLAEKITKDVEDDENENFEN